MEQTLVYVNPSSGSGRGLRAWRAVLAAHQELSQAKLVLESCPIQGKARLQEALRREPRRLIAIGGDGTAQMIAAEIFRSGQGDSIGFGLIPAGTGSDLARSLGLPKGPVAALRHLLAKAPRPFDLIQARTESGRERLCINISSVGVSGAVALAVNARPNRGQLPYLRSTLSALLRYDPAPCKIWVDGEIFYDGGFFVLAVANGRFFGKGMQVAPQARPDDGFFDVVLVPPLPLWQLPFRLPLFVAGRHQGWDGVLYRRAQRLRIEPMGELPPFELDGETLPAEPTDFTIRPGALNIFA